MKNNINIQRKLKYKNDNDAIIALLWIFVYLCKQIIIIIKFKIIKIWLESGQRIQSGKKV